MNLQQLEYIVAVDTYRHFIRASEKCFVTQATLSMMIRKLEDELEVRIFDRSKQPVIPTPLGEKIIEQARVVLNEAEKIKNIALQDESPSGDLRVGIIPTVAPYLLPLFLQRFLKNYPLVRLQVSELTTEEILSRLEKNELDAGILAIPLHKSKFNEETLFYEEFAVYASNDEILLKKKFILAEDIDVNRLWLLEEGHCLRSQVVNLCELKQKEKNRHQLDFSAGSIETLKRIVEADQGITILPQLAIKDMTAKQKKRIRFFKSPVPVREIGLVTYRYHSREKLIRVLIDSILQSLPEEVKKRNSRQQQVVPISL